jgi:hypothetical protein
MPQSNADLGRLAVDAFNRRDRDGFFALMAPDVVVESRLSAVEGAYHGREGLERWWDDLLGVFPEYVVAIDRERELGEWVVARFKAEAHGTTPLFDSIWQVSRWHDGLCVSWRMCETEEEAVEVARSGV